MRQPPKARRRGRGSALGAFGAVGLLLIALAAVAAVGQLWLGESPGWAHRIGLDRLVTRAEPTTEPTQSSGSPVPPGTALQPPATIQPATPTGRFRYAGGPGPALGRGGTVHEFRVAVEDGSNVDLTEFENLVDATLGDARSWIAGGTLRFQRVADGAAADLTIYLATPKTAQQLCLAGGVNTIIDGVPYTSCRVGGKVIVNLDRYQKAVPHFGADLTTYRQYVINHEVGHFLGHNHEGCPGAGRPAPVMQQQTLGLAGCVANAWPYLDGRRYAGPPTGP